MKSFMVVMSVAVVLALVLPGEYLAQRAMRLVHPGRYVLGEVLSIDKIAYGRGQYYGVRLLLKTAQGRLSVHLGPSWFVNSQTMKIALHDLIEVTGSRVVYEGQPALIAARIWKGHESLRLRTADGMPLWRGSETH